MASQDSFDAYYRWLGIPPAEQPPHLYRLLGVAEFEADQEVLATSADRQMTFVRSYATGPHSELSQRILNELAQARVTLLDPQKKAVYDKSLRSRLAAKDQPVVPTPAAPIAAAPAAPAPKPQKRARPAAANQPAEAAPQIVTEHPIEATASRSLARAQRLKPTLTIGAMAGVVVFVCAILFTQFSHGTGELVIESSEPGIEIELLREGVKVDTVTVAGVTTEIKVKTGEYEVVLKGQEDDKLLVENGTFTLTRGGRVVVKISRRKSVPAAAAQTDVAEQQPAPPAEPAEQPSAAEPSAPAKVTVVVSPQKPQPRPMPEPVEDTVTQPTAEFRNQKFARLHVASDAKSLPLVNGDSSHAGGAWSDIPTEFEEMEFVPGKGGKLIFSVQQPGVVLVLVTSRWGGGGNPSGGWMPELTTQQQFLDMGWKEVAALQHSAGSNYRFKIFARECPAGERFLLRTEKYIAPALVVPDESLLTRVENIEVDGLYQMAAATPGQLAPADAGATQPASPPQPPAAAERIAVPDQAALDASRAQVRDLFADDMEAAKTDEDKLKLARSWLELAAQSKDDLPGQYVLADAARKYAAEAGDVRVALDAAMLLTDTFDVERWPLLVATAEVAADGSNSSDQHKAIAQEGMKLADQAKDARKFDVAESLLQLATRSAVRARDFTLSREARDRSKAIEAEVALLKEAQQAQKTLAENPDDPAANEAYGRYLCLVDGDWSKGLAHLAKSGDNILAETAEADLKQPASAEEQLQLADAWYEYGKGPKQNEPFLTRAHKWYKAVTLDKEVAGLERVKAQRRLESLADFASADEPTQSPAQPTVPVVSRNLAQTLAGLKQGMIGRVSIDKTVVVPALVYSGPDVTYSDGSVRKVFPDTVAPNARVHVELLGVINVEQDTTIKIRQKGGSSNGGHARVALDNIELGVVGDDNEKDKTHEVSVTKGAHLIRWVLTGGSMGGGFLRVTDEADQPIPIELPDSLKNSVAQGANVLWNITPTP